VAFDKREQVDEAATRKLRAKRREARRRKDGKVRILSGKVRARVADNLEVRREKDGLRMCCSKCAADLGPIGDNYKLHAQRVDSDIRASNPHVGDYKRYLDARPVFRQFHCPGCGALLENEIALSTDELLHDIELKMRVRMARGRFSRPAPAPCAQGPTRSTPAAAPAACRAARWGWMPCHPQPA
jgi:acetone carboxylase gamma subunit